MGRLAKITVIIGLLCCWWLPPVVAAGGDSRISDERIPLDPNIVPDRPKPILELGEPFLGTGTLAPGFQLPTGAVWQPSLLVFGTLRTAFQSNGYSPSFGDARVTEAAGRLDLFANLALSGSERLVLGFRNLDEDGRFTSHVFDTEIPGEEDGGIDEVNAEINSLFFEGDIGEIFPNISPRDFKPTDIGFSIGRQPLFFQEGLLINDSIDGVGFTLNSLQPKKSSNFRTTFFYGWNNVNRNNIATDMGDMFGLFTSIDYPKSTVELDVVYGQGEAGAGDLMAVGISAVQRFGHINTSFRVLGSNVDDNDFGGETDGYLFFSEISFTPYRTHDLFYVNSFYTIDTYTPAALGPGNGGPLGRAGVNFAGVGLGQYGAPLNAAASDVAGGAVGYQMFLDHTRKQLIFELAARVGLEDLIEDQYGFTIRYQMALLRRFVIIIDAFANHQDAFDDQFFGGRAEFQVRF